MSLFKDAGDYGIDKLHLQIEKQFNLSFYFDWWASVWGVFCDVDIK